MLLIPAYAKINLCLTVQRRRADGFHEIDSIAVAIDWHDLLGIATAAAATTSVRLRLSGDDALLGTVPRGDDNLAVRAARAMAARTGPLALSLWLDKRIPSLAGLGGGSADAAAVLRALDSLTAATTGRDGGAGNPLAEVAAGLGSDVPVALAGGAQRMRGRGDVLAAVAAPALHMAVAVAGPSATAATYAAAAPGDFEDGARAARVAAALAAGMRPDDTDLGSGLEAPACRAAGQLGDRLRRLRAAVPEATWHLTGSGGAAFALAADARAAAALAAAARGAGFPARACRTVAAVPR